MNTRLSRFFLPLAIVAAVIVLAMPEATFAATAKKKAVAYDLYNPRKTYGDEKAQIVNPTSRCNTPAVKKTHLANEVRAAKDLNSLTASTTPVVGELYQTYLKKLDLAWGAMEEPYCGFGAFGPKAAIASYQKSVTRTRNEFLLQARKIQNAK